MTDYSKLKQWVQNITPNKLIPVNEATRLKCLDYEDQLWLDGFLVVIFENAIKIFIDK